MVNSIFPDLLVQLMSLSYEVRAWYCKEEVRREIADFCRNRWIALFGRGVVRYDREGNPLSIEEPYQIPEILERFSSIKPRSFYATSATYLRLSFKEDVEDEGNVMSYTPYWDIDNEASKWKATVEVVQVILRVLEREGISNSAYVLWTGRGMHVNLHQKSISMEVVRKYGALNVAWAVVEYVRGKIIGNLQEIRERHEAFRLRVDNEMKPKNLFSVPLSLHRSVNSAVICVSPSDLDFFDPSWANPNSFKHNKNWRSFHPGEADYLAEKAIRIYGGYPYLRARYRRKEPRVEDMIRKWLGDQDR